MFATIRQRPQIAAALVSLPLLAIVYAALAGGSPAEAPQASVNLLNGVTVKAARWALLEMTTHLPDPDAVIWTTATFSQTSEPDVWVVQTRAHYTADGPDGQTQAFVVWGTFVDDPDINPRELRLVGLRHVPRFAGVDFDSPYGRPADSLPLH